MRARGLAILAVMAFASAARAERVAPPPVRRAAPAVCRRLEVANQALERELARSGPRKLWLIGTPGDDARALRAALARQGVRVLAHRGDEVLVVATAAQRAALPAAAELSREADELDWLGCGQLGFRVGAVGGVPAVATPAGWRDAGGPGTYCVQLVAGQPDDAELGALARVLGLVDAPTLSCTDTPGTCLLAMTPAQAAAVARLPFVRGAIRRQPAMKLGASLACPDLGDVPVPPGELAALTQAVVTPPGERVDVTVLVDGEPEDLARFAAWHPPGLDVITGSGSLWILSVERRLLPALAGRREVTHVLGKGPPPEPAAAP